MDNQELHGLVTQLEPNARVAPNVWEMQIEDVQITIITDEYANRMRIIAPIADEESLTEIDQKQLLQANFDLTLDVRYAIAHGLIWAAFLHPFTSLTRDDFLSGLEQVVNCAMNYGGTYSSGVLVFGGGDHTLLN